MVHDDFEEHDYGLKTSVSSSQEESVNIVLNRTDSNSCSLDGCPLGPNPADRAWIELMSSIPKKRSAEINFKSELSNSPMPEPHVMDEIVNTLRPYNGETHSIEAVREEWEEVFKELDGAEGVFQSMVKELALDWKGEDFDVIEEHAGQLIRASNTTCDNIEVFTAELFDQEETIFHLQGGDTGQIPYPAPQFFDADRGKSDASIHVRVPFWDQGDCQIMTNDAALEFTGGDKSAPDYFHQREEERVEEIMEERLEVMTPQEREAQNLGVLENEAQKQAQDEVQVEVDAFKQEVHNGQLGESERLSQEVIANRDQADSTLMAAKFNAEPVEIERQDFTEQANGPSYGGLTSPAPVGSPDGAAMLAPGGHTPGVSPTVAEVEEARYGSVNDAGIWDSVGDVDDDEPSDGLFSGAGGSGGAVNAVSAPGAGAVSPGGGAVGSGGAVGAGGAVGSGMVPGGRPGMGPSGASGAGRGSGGGSGAGAGRGGGNMVPGMIGGGAGAGQGQGHNNAKGSQQGRTMSQAGRPTGSSAAAGPARVGAGQGKEEKVEKKPGKYRTSLAAALEQRQAEKEAQKKRALQPESSEPEELDFHDEFDIEEDTWGAHSARKDEYR